MGEHTKEFTDQNFETEVLQSTKPVLVDFWAPWCGPCRQIGPIVEELATQMADQFVIGKLNIDESPNVSDRYGIQAIPTLLVFKGGEVVGRVQPGPKSRMQQQLEAHAG